MRSKRPFLPHLSLNSHFHRWVILSSPLHFYVGDQSGKVIVVEYINGRCQINDNPLGVLTNSPPFMWHIANLSNYVNLSPVTVPQLDLSHIDVKNFGQGTGLLGLPGDYTPPSRFIRASLFSQWAHPEKDASDTARLGFHILNTFDIFEGIVRSGSSSPDSKDSHQEITEWTIVHDRTHLKSYFRNYFSLRIQMVDFKKVDFSTPGFRTIALESSFDVKDSTLDAVSITP